MSFTLFCLVKGNTTANAFPVHIDKGQFVGDLKKAIKAENRMTLLDDLLRNLTLNDGDELFVTREIVDYWSEKPPKRHIPVLVDLSPSTAVSRNYLIVLHCWRNRSASPRMFYIVVSPRRTKSFKWTVNIDHATLESLKESIREGYKPPSLENDGAELSMLNGSGKFSPRNDQSLREMLRIFVSKNNLKFTVFIETPSKPFSEWSFSKVCQLYGLGESDDPSLSVFPPFTCEYKELNDDSSQEILRNLITELKARLETIPINGNEASKSQYVCSYLVAGERQVRASTGKNITGPNGHGPVDFEIDLLQTTKTVGVTEVKDEDIFKGIAQNAVQLESALSNRKRKANEMEEDRCGKMVFYGVLTRRSGQDKIQTIEAGNCCI